MDEFSITDQEIFDYIYNQLIDRGLAPYKDDVEVITEVFIDLMEELGVAEEQ